MAGWRTGPIDPRGVLHAASSRNLLCLAMSPVPGSNEAVVGSADHALYGFDYTTGKSTRKLYSKRFGHSEWVTCVSYTADGRVISGAMDSKLCLWGARGSRCDDLVGHTSSISALQCGDAKAPNVAVSGSYDRTLMVWDLQRKTSVATLKAHRGPIICFDWSGGQLLSGARDGTAAIWDLERATETGEGSPVRKFKADGGHVTSVAAYRTHGGGGGADSSPLLLTGHQDGRVRLWDARAAGAKPVIAIGAHRTEDGGAGAVGNIVCTNAKNELTHLGGNVIVTAGADKTICVLDPRSTIKPCARFSQHRDYIYALKVVGSLAVSGAGDGVVLVHNLRKGNLLYGIGANQHAVKCIITRQHMMITAGDDGSTLTFRFS